MNLYKAPRIKCTGSILNVRGYDKVCGNAAIELAALFTILYALLLTL